MALHDPSLSDTPSLGRPDTLWDPGERQRLLSGTHHDPHALLGAHPGPGGGVVLRALRPYARGVSVLVDGRPSRLDDDGDGFFSALLPFDPADAAMPDYTLLVSYDGGESEVEDPYRFLPALGELDLHLIREGRHEEL